MKTQTFDEKSLIKKLARIDISDGFCGMVFMFEKGKNKKKPLILVKIVESIWKWHYHFVDTQTGGKIVNDFINYRKMIDKRNHSFDENAICFLRHCTKKEAEKLCINISEGLRERYEDFYGEKL